MMVLHKKPCTHPRVDDEDVQNANIGSSAVHPYEVLYNPHSYDVLFQSQHQISQWLSDLFQHEFSVHGKKHEIETTTLNNGFLILNLTENKYQWLSNDAIANASFHPHIYISKFKNDDAEINENNNIKNNNPLWLSFTEDHYISSLQYLPKVTLSQFLQMHNLKYGNKTKSDICVIIVREFLKVIASVADISDEDLCKKLKISNGIANRWKMMFQLFKQLFGDEILLSLMTPPNQDESQFFCPYRYNLKSYTHLTQPEFYISLKDIDYQIIKKTFNSIHPCRKYDKSLAFFDGDIYNALQQSLRNRCYNIQFMDRNDIYSILDCYQISYLESQPELDLIHKILKHEYSSIILEHLTLSIPAKQKQKKQKTQRLQKKESIMNEQLAYNKDIRSTWPPNISNNVIQHCTDSYMQGTNLQQPHTCCCCSRKRFNVDMNIVKLSENYDICKDLNLDLLIATKEEFQIYFQHPIEN